MKLYNNTAIFCFCCLAVVLAGCSSSSEPGTLPDLASFKFKSEKTALIKGDQSTEKADSIPGCTGIIDAADSLGDLALVSVFGKTRCYLDADHTHGDYKVEQGKLVSSNGITLVAYRIHEPARKAAVSLDSEHGIFFRFDTKEDHLIYELSGQALIKRATVSSSQIRTDTYIRVSDLTASSITGSKIYAFVPSSTKIERLNTLGPGVMGARVAQSGVGDVLLYRHTVTQTPFDTTRDYTSGPAGAGNRYGQNRQFFLVGPLAGKVGLVWQDKSSAELLLTWLAEDQLTLTHTKLPATTEADVLAAATADAAGNIYYLTIQTGDGAPDATRRVTLFKADAAGALVKKVTLDGAKTSPGLNMVQFADTLASNRYAGTLRVSGDKLGLMLGRKMHKASDGLNHQGGIAVVFDTGTLAQLKNHGQTSGHSFGNVLMVNSDGKFVGIDLGDNYPRGINLHKFDHQSKVKPRVVYTFKTRHGSTANNPAGKTFSKYDEASAGGTTYYQWSNDNSTYTELGGVAQTDEGYLVIFAGERPSLDNTKVGSNLNTPRDIGFVLVREDFENASKPTGSSSCTNNVMVDDLVLSQGDEEKGGFYSFSGGWCDQRNKGIGWLTSYASILKNASRVKVVPLPRGRVLVLWEVWSDKAYLGTWAVKIDHKGKKLGEPTELGSWVRLGRRDEPLVDADGQVYLVAGDKTAKVLDLVVIEP